MVKLNFFHFAEIETSCRDNTDDCGVGVAIDGKTAGTTLA